MTTPSLRSLAGALALLAAAVLAGCASGSPRPKPAELPPNVDLIGVRQAWHATLAPIAFPLQVHTLGSQVLLASGDGTVVTLDARNGAELGRAGVGAPLSAGVGGDGRMAAVVTRANEVVALAGGRVLWRHRLPTQSYTAPLVAGGRVFVLGADRSLTAL
ncbi:MAG: PQQ-binding-like beta-propeller repeat protein, partial [Proteobacteria bacterium]|nr:PQQ-binding-like beta-propeller repeat protein [Pseudomonadota bacterium]